LELTTYRIIHGVPDKPGSPIKIEAREETPISTTMANGNERKVHGGKGDNKS